MEQYTYHVRVFRGEGKEIIVMESKEKDWKSESNLSAYVKVPCFGIFCSEHRQ
jgi:hypothetical protein